MSSLPPPRSGNRMLFRLAIGTGVAGLLCIIAATAIFAIELSGADRAEARTPGDGEGWGWGFLALIAIFPGGVLLLIAALVLVIVTLARRR